MSTAAKHLRRLVVALERGRPLSEEVADWLHRGARRYLDECGACDLETALGLRGPGVRTVWTCIATEERNAALRQAFDCCALPGARDSAWRRCQILAAAIRRFERRLDSQSEPTRSLSGIERAISRAFRAGGGVPRSARALYELLK